MTEDIKIEDKKELTKEELKRVNGGSPCTDGLTKCPKCHVRQFDDYTGTCYHCGYKW